MDIKRTILIVALAVVSYVMVLKWNQDYGQAALPTLKAVFDSPTGKVPGKNLLLLARSNDLDHPRLGLVIGKKSVKLSVQRNRLKRLMRESFRLHQDLLVGWDIVIVARKGLGDVENPELIQHFGKLWKRLARNTPVPAAKTETVGVGSPNA